MSVFGNITTSVDVEGAMEAHVVKWITTYLREVERQKGLKVGLLPSPRSYQKRNELQRWPEDQMPAIVIVAPGTAGTPKRKGDGTYDANWVCGVAAVVSSTDKESTRTMASYYTAAIRAAVLQHRSIGGFARGVTYEDERFDDLPEVQGRSLVSGQVFFTVQVSAIVDSSQGPSQPSDDPAEWPDVETAQVTIQKED